MAGDSFRCRVPSSPDSANLKIPKPVPQNFRLSRCPCSGPGSTFEGQIFEYPAFVQYLQQIGQHNFIFGNFDGMNPRNLENLSTSRFVNIMLFPFEFRSTSQANALL